MLKIISSFLKSLWLFHLKCTHNLFGDQQMKFNDVRSRSHFFITSPLVPSSFLRLFGANFSSLNPKVNDLAPSWHT